MSIAPLHAFREATRASARTIEREGRRIGYVHVWASVGEGSANALKDALDKMGATTPFFLTNTRGSGRRSGEPPRLDGLIVDMRGKIGGSGSNATWTSSTRAGRACDRATGRMRIAPAPGCGDAPLC
jgi:C-terminal processing protease CtpA/Prc